MSVYKRGGVCWYKFKFAGQLIRESTKTRSKMVAVAAERARRRELEGGFNGIGKPQRVQMLSVAAEGWLLAQSAHLAPRSVVIEQANLKHLNLFFGKKLLCDITADDIAHYQALRLRELAAPKTINLEVRTLRAILRKNRLWANIQPDVRMLRTSENVGMALSQEEEVACWNAADSADPVHSILPWCWPSIRVCGIRRFACCDGAKWTLPHARLQSAKAKQIRAPAERFR